MGERETPMQDRSAVAARYLRFAEDELHGRSPLYEAIARGVASDPDIIDFLLTLPEAKQQPNLLLAAVRHVCGTANDWPHFRELLRSDRDAVGALMRSRSTQTNEPARCAALLPVLARLPQPLALLEVGAAAGLCLLPDHYGYDYGGAILAAGARAPSFRCAVSGAMPIPAALPRIDWRAGLDLNPVDIGDPSHVAWLETLVWPEQAGRLANLRAALRIAAAARPRVVKGDLTGAALAQLAHEAPRHATLVIFHTAVLAYVPDQAERQAFAERAMRLGTWISNEMPGVFPDIARRAGARGAPGRFLLSVNGTPVAWTDPHGSSMDWIEP